jgi:hypothetical protein
MGRPSQLGKVPLARLIGKLTFIVAREVEFDEMLPKQLLLSLLIGGELRDQLLISCVHCRIRRSSSLLRESLPICWLPVLDHWLACEYDVGEFCIFLCDIFPLSFE